MAKHTQGPWKAFQQGEDHEGRREWAIQQAAAPYEYICQVIRGGEEPIDDLEVEANATLVAQAPTLLAALKVIALTPEIRNWLREHDPKALEQTERAIDKAEGVTL